MYLVLGVHLRLYQRLDSYQTYDRKNGYETLAGRIFTNLTPDKKFTDDAEKSLAL